MLSSVSVGHKQWDFFALPGMHHCNINFGLNSWYLRTWFAISRINCEDTAS